MKQMNGYVFVRVQASSHASLHACMHIYVAYTQAFIMYSGGLLGSFGWFGHGSDF